MINSIKVMPTKSFFVDMITKDISLERCILDLVDNSVDAAKKLRGSNYSDNILYKGLRVDISISNSNFEISDNCGGFKSKDASDYAFRFGRDPNYNRTDSSIGQFGIGMKRAIFKIAQKFEISSVTTSESWKMEVDLEEWEKNEDWHFEFTEIKDKDENQIEGTIIRSQVLRNSIGIRFGTQGFLNSLAESIKRAHRLFIAKGLEIYLNGIFLESNEINILSGGINPVAVKTKFQDNSGDIVDIKIISGLGQSKPSDAGWYVICNGRVIMSADKSKDTGWGDPLLNVQYHPSLARFRGIVYFDSKNAGALPWNTGKTYINTDAEIWIFIYPMLIDAMRETIDKIRDLETEIREKGQEHSRIYSAILQSKDTKIENITLNKEIKIAEYVKVIAEHTVTITYHRKISDVERLKDLFRLQTAKAVGEKTFDIVINDLPKE